MNSLTKLAQHLARSLTVSEITLINYFIPGLYYDCTSSVLTPHISTALAALAVLAVLAVLAALPAASNICTRTGYVI